MAKFRLLVFVLLGMLFLGWSLAEAAPGDTIADGALGQANFNGSSSNGGGSPGANGLNWPYGMAVNNQNGRLFAADYLNNRVLSWPDSESFANNAPADIVIGQNNFTNAAANQGGSADADTLNGPVGIAIDQRTDRLYVSDFSNHRVLVYAPPFTTGMAANWVYGQSNFTNNSPNQGGLDAGSLENPWGLAFDNDYGHLFVADWGNNRVLEYGIAFNPAAINVYGQPDYGSDQANNGGVSDHALHGPMGLAYEPDSQSLAVADGGNHRVLIFGLNSPYEADYVFGQNGSFTTNIINNGGLGPDSLYTPTDVAFDNGRHLYIADRYNNRVLYFNLNLPSQADDTADQVFGQPNFTSNTANNGGVSAASFSNPIGLAVTPEQNLLVADRSNHRILRFDQPQPFGQPGIFDIGPEQVAIGSPGFEMLVRGNGFVPQSVVTWNGQALPTGYLDATHLIAFVNQSLIATPFNAQIKVVNPAPGGGTSGQSGIVTDYNAVSGDATADRLLGKSSFNIASWSFTAEIGVGPRTLDSPTGIAVAQASDRLYAADTGNNRILSWANTATLQNGAAADFVIGQPDLYNETLNFGGVSASSLNSPRQIALDNSGNLYVADQSNHRVLVYLAPTAGSTVADLVFGQPSFNTNSPDNGGLSAASLDYPAGVIVAPDGTVFIADTGNSRVLIYHNPLTTDRTADVVLGQVDFISSNQNQGNATPNATSLSLPLGMALDADGRLYVADAFNHRVVVYAPPFTNGKAASFVFGQPTFTSNTPNNGGLNANSLEYPGSVSVDGGGNVIITDRDNNRVLGYDEPVAQDNRTADRVFGQPDFNSDTTNNGGLSQNALHQPAFASIGAGGDIYVSDASNNRLLVYENSLQSGFLNFLPAVMR